MKRFVTILLALVMILSLATTAFAAETGSITITPPSGLDSSANNTYKIYKVFDAVGDGTNISYKLVQGKTTAPEGFTVDAAGNVTTTAETLTDAMITAIADYVKNDDPAATVTTTGSTAVTASGLSNGYYYITTSTGSVVTIDTTNPNATVTDKNTAPTVTKIITGASSVDADGKKALAQVGSAVTFKATITVGNGAVGYVFHDKMGSGLQYKNDVAVSGVDSSMYTIENPPKADDTITITFKDGIAKDTVITITYSATVTSDALTQEPAKNTAWLDYGDENSNNETPDSTTEVWNAKFTVTKKDGNQSLLKGAGFVVMNSEGKYYKLENNVVSWVENIADATEYASDENGAVTAFTGLASGTYTLVEKTVPAGYNKAANTEFTIAAGNYTVSNLEQSTTVINKAGTELPETGGVGTTMFYVVGGLMMLMAVVLLVTKKRMADAE